MSEPTSCCRSGADAANRRCRSWGGVGRGRRADDARRAIKVRNLPVDAEARSIRRHGESVARVHVDRCTNPSPPRRRASQPRESVTCAPMSASVLDAPVRSRPHPRLGRECRQVKGVTMQDDELTSRYPRCYHLADSPDVWPSVQGARAAQRRCSPREMGGSIGGTPPPPARPPLGDHPHIAPRVRHCVPTRPTPLERQDARARPDRHDRPGLAREAQPACLLRPNAEAPGRPARGLRRSTTAGPAPRYPVPPNGSPVPNATGRDQHWRSATR